MIRIGDFVCVCLKSFRIHKHNTVPHIVFIVMEHRINGFCIYIQPDGFSTEKKTYNAATKGRREKKEANQTIRKFHFPFVEILCVYIPLLRVYCLLWLWMFTNERPTWAHVCARMRKRDRCSISTII